MIYKKLSVYLRNCKILNKIEMPYSIQYVLSCPELVILECQKERCVELYRQKEKEVKKLKV